MVNKIILIGRVGQDPDVNYMDNGKAVAKFTLATSETFKNKSGDKTTNTTWHNIVLWNKAAELVEKYVKKGDLLCVEGKQINRSYEKNGETKYISEVITESFQMLTPKKDQ